VRGPVLCDSGAVSRPDLAAALDLAPHPEGGWFRRTWTSPTAVPTPHGDRPTATAILYLMDGPGRWHRVRSTELWLWHSGSAAELVLGGDGDEPGIEQVLRLGPATAGGHTPRADGPRTAATGTSDTGTSNGMGGGGTGGDTSGDTRNDTSGDTRNEPGAADPETLPQREVPAGVWQRAYPLGDDPVLVSCVVSPGFDFADFELR
jgi:predicted cupin superfamily sugar epimerase